MDERLWNRVGQCLCGEQTGTDGRAALNGAGSSRPEDRAHIGQRLSQTGLTPFDWEGVGMELDTRVLKAYLDHFLPRDVIGPVIVVFSLEGVIDGIFSLYVPEQYSTLGWGVIFVLALVVVAYWGSVDEQAVEELQEQVDRIEQQDTDSE